MESLTHLKHDTIMLGSLIFYSATEVVSNSYVISMKNMELQVYNIGVTIENI